MPRAPRAERSILTPLSPVREGDAAAAPSVQFDAELRLPYHLNAAGERVYHDAPAGLEFAEDGTLRPVVIPPPADADAE